MLQRSLTGSSIEKEKQWSYTHYRCEGWLGFPDLWSGQKPWSLIFNPYGEFRWSPEDPVSQIHSPHLHVGTSGIFSELLSCFQMLKRERERERERGAEKNGKLSNLLIDQNFFGIGLEHRALQSPRRKTTVWKQDTVKEGRNTWYGITCCHS